MSAKKSIGEEMKLPWKDMPLAGNMLQPGSAVEYRTGDWRISIQPQIDHEKCIMCLFCWVFCPDVAITRNDERVEVDLDHCKGCGICSEECPVDAIAMVEV